MRKVKQVLGALLIIFMTMSSLLYTFQEKLIFLPTSLEQDYVYDFEEPFEEFFLKTNDGAKLNALYFKNSCPKGVILYFHGNAGDLSRWGETATFFVKKDFDVIIMDYRTYGKSTGKINEDNLFNDAQLFYDHTLEYYSENDIIIYGRSLGAAIATQLASKNRSRQLILETPFFNLLDVAKDRFAFLPLKQLLKYNFSSNQYIKDVECPIAIFHGTEDAVVPYKSGEKLFGEITGDNKQLYTITGGGHNNLIDFKSYHLGIEKELNQMD